MQAHLLENGLVVVGVADNGHRIVVLGGRTEHGGTTDIDVLDGIGKGDVGVGNRLLKLVEVHDHHVDELDAVLRGLSHVLLRVAAGEQRAVDLGVKRLHASVHHLRVAREVLDGAHRNARLLDGLRRTARGDNLHPELLDQRTGKINNARLVGHRDQRTRDLTLSSHISSLPFASPARCGAAKEVPLM